MPTGLAAATANGWLNVLRGTTYTGLAGLFVKLHIGDPGGAGTNNPSALTTRNALTLNAASGGVCTLSALAAFTMTATETISHVSLWDASTAGTFIASGALSVAKPVNASDTLTFNTFTLSAAPVAAT
jgi:hypothetical protein